MSDGGNFVRIGLNNQDFLSGVDESKASIKGLADVSRAAGKQTADGLKKTGDAAKDAAKQAREAERAAKQAAQTQERRSMALENQILRETAALQAGSKQTRAYYELLIEQRGLDKARFEGLLQQLDKQNNTIKTATLSTQQYANALRMVPMQFTDIITQLAGGQSPFLIAIQQGGQLRDSFGGFGTMFKGIADTLWKARGMLAGAGVAGAVGGLALAIYKGAEESRQYQKTITLLGDSAGVTAGELQDLAVSVGALTGNYSGAREAAMWLAENGAVDAENYRRYAEAIVQFSDASGQSIEEVAKKYEEIAKDPLKFIQEMARRYKTLTPAVYAQVQALIAQGREQEAVRLIQDKFSEENAKMARDVAENLGFVEKAWRGVKSGISGGWDSVKSIGRNSTLQEQLELVQAQIAQGGRSLGAGAPYYASYAAVDVAALREREAALKAQIALEEKQAKASGEAGKQHLQAIEAQRRLADGYLNTLPRHVQLERELTQLAKDREAALRGISDYQQKRTIQAQYEAKVADAQSRLAPKTNLDALHAELLREESASRSGRERGQARHYDSKGNVLLGPQTRYGRAVGIGQIIPQFGADYARMAGLAWDKNRLYNDPEYNKALSKGGLATYMRMFEDDPQKALAAYNWGAGNVKNAINKYGNNWFGRAPAETTAYVNNILSRVGMSKDGEYGGDYIAQPKNAFDELVAKQRQTLLEITQKLNLSQEELNRHTADFWKMRASDEWNTLSAAEQNQLAETDRQTRAAQDADLLQRDYAAQLADLARQAEMVGKVTTLEGLRYELEKGRLKGLAPERRAELETSAAAVDAAKKKFEFETKYRNAAKDFEESSKRDFEDQLFELELLGKTREKIERLTEARKYDRLIAEATEKGVDPAIIGQLQTAKLDNDGRIEERQRLERETKAAYGQDWMAGIRDGVNSYIDSVGSLREEVAGLVDDSIGRMGDSLAEFALTSKLNFREMTVSILQDLSKMLMRMAVVRAMQMAISGISGGGGLASGEGLYGNAGNFSGWSDGGYTGSGGKYEPAGIVHKGEVVFSQADVQRHGGVERVESLRLRGYADGGIVGRAPLAALNGVQGGGNTVVNVTINRDGAAESSVESDAQAGKALGAFVKAQIEEWAYKNMSRQGQPYYRGA